MSLTYQMDPDMHRNLSIFNYDIIYIGFGACPGPFGKVEVKKAEK